MVGVTYVCDSINVQYYVYTNKHDCTYSTVYSLNVSCIRWNSYSIFSSLQSCKLHTYASHSDIRKAPVLSIVGLKRVSHVLASSM